MSESKSFLVTVMKWRKDTSIWPGFQDSYCSNQQLVLCKRLTLSAASILVTEGLFICIYFLLFEKNHQNRISRAGEKISPTISLFFREMIAEVSKFSCAKRFKKVGWF